MTTTTGDETEGCYGMVSKTKEVKSTQDTLESTVSSLQGGGGLNAEIKRANILRREDTEAT